MAKVLLFEQLPQRSLNSLILIGHFLEKRGHQVKISLTGSYLIKALYEFRPDIIYACWVTPSLIEIIRKFNNNAIIVNSYQEQSVLFFENKSIIDFHQLKLSPYFLAWGSYTYQKAKELNPDIVEMIAGVPKFDVYSSNKVQDVFLLNREQLARKFNIPLEKEWLFIPLDFGMVLDEKEKQHLLKAKYIDDGYVKNEEIAFVKLRNWLQKAVVDFPNTIFIIRNHPGYPQKPLIKYQNLSHYSNVFYITDLHISNWLLACDKVATRISTSIIEAWLCNKPYCILFKDIVPNYYKKAAHVTEAKNEANNYQSFADFLDKNISSFQSSRQEHHLFLEKYFGIIDGNASERTANYLTEIAINNQSKIQTTSSNSTYLSKFSVEYIFHSTYAWFKTWLNESGLIEYYPFNNPNKEYFCEKKLLIKKRELHNL